MIFFYYIPNLILIPTGKCGYHPSPKEPLFVTNGHNAETDGLWGGEGEGKEIQFYLY